MTTHQTSSPRERRPQGGNAFSRFFSSIGLYVAQVIDEMRKVVYPTRKELITYTVTVITFVTVIMLYTMGLDAVFTRLVTWVFAGTW